MEYSILRAGITGYRKPGSFKKKQKLWTNDLSYTQLNRNLGLGSVFIFMLASIVLLKF